MAVNNNQNEMERFLSQLNQTKEKALIKLSKKVQRKQKKIENFETKQLRKIDEKFNKKKVNFPNQIEKQKKRNFLLTWSSAIKNFVKSVVLRIRRFSKSLLDWIKSQFLIALQWVNKNHGKTGIICSAILIILISPFFIKNCHSNMALHAQNKIEKEKIIAQKISDELAKKDKLNKEKEAAALRDRQLDIKAQALEAEQKKIDQLAEKERILKQKELNALQQKLNRENEKKLAIQRKVEVERQKKLDEKRKQQEARKKAIEEKRKKEEKEKKLALQRKLEAERQKRLNEKRKAQEAQKKAIEEKKRREQEKKRKLEEAEQKRLDKLKSLSVKELNDLADKAIDKKQWEKAQEYTNFALEKDDQSWRANRNQGRIEANQKQYKKAANAFFKALQFKKDFPQLWYEYGKMLYRLRRYIPAANAFGKALEYKADFREAAFNRGLSYEKAGKTSNALVAFQKSASIDPKHSRSWYKVGSLQSAIEHYGEAVSAFEQAITNESDNSVYYGDLGLALFKNKELDDSEKAFRKSLQLDKKNAASNFNLANVKMDQGDFEEALKYATIAVDLKSDSEYLYRAGVIAQNAGMESAALNYYQRAIDTGNANVDNLVNLGALYDKNGKYQKAVEILLQGYKRSPNSREVNYNLGNAYLHLGDNINAKKHYRIVIKNHPEDSRARYYLAIAFIKTNLYQQASSELMTVIQQEPQFYDAYYQLGKLYWEIGNKKVASNFFMKLLELNPHYPKASEIDALLADSASSQEVNE